MRFSKLYILLLAVFVFLPGCGQEVIPEMKECISAHGNMQKYQEVIKKYAAPELLPDITICCTLENSRVIHTEKVGDVLYYWEEGRLLESSYEIPAQTIQMIKVGWKNKKIVYLEFLGPMRFHEKKFVKSPEALLKERKITR